MIKATLRYTREMIPQAFPQSHQHLLQGSNILEDRTHGKQWLYTGDIRLDDCIVWNRQTLSQHRTVQYKSPAIKLIRLYGQFLWNCFREHLQNVKVRFNQHLAVRVSTNPEHYNLHKESPCCRTVDLVRVNELWQTADLNRDMRWWSKLRVILTRPLT